MLADPGSVRGSGAIEVDRTIVVYKSAHAYSSHPCVTRLATGDWLVAFSQSIERTPFLHPPSDPRFLNLLVRSSDEGRTWSEPRVTPGYEWSGVETPGIAQLSSGEVLLNQWRFRWYPLELAKKLWGRGEEIFVSVDGHRWHPAKTEHDWERHPFPYARADDGAYVHISGDDGHTWDVTVRLEIEPFRGGFSPKGAIEIGDGHLLLALGSPDYDPRAACFVVRSRDGGRTWERPVEAAHEPGLVFSEPSIVQTRGGDLLLFAREEQTGYVYACRSSDRGLTWSPPARLPLWGYPTHGVCLADGRIAIVYGRRREPFGIRAALSEDEGRSWGPEVVVRDDLPNENLGYPSAIEYAPGKLFTAYYGEDADRVTCIQGTYFEV